MTAAKHTERKEIGDVAMGLGADAGSAGIVRTKHVTFDQPGQELALEGELLARLIEGHVLRADDAGRAGVGAEAHGHVADLLALCVLRCCCLLYTSPSP